MNGHGTSTSRSSSLRPGGILALAAGLFVAVPIASAAASEPDAAVSEPAGAESDALLVERIDERSEQLRALARELIRRAIGRSAHRAREAGRTVELMMGWGFGLHELTMARPAVFEPAQDDGRSEPGETPRFDFEITNDPLAGV
jgi:hypothetical protein